MAGLDTNEFAIIRGGFEAEAIAHSATGGEFLLQVLPPGPQDIIATRVVRTNGIDSIPQMILRRGVDLPDGATLPVLDFSAPEAFAPAVANVSLSGIGVGGAAISEATYREALSARERLAEAFASWATPYDAILTPAAVGEAPTPETTGDPRFCTRWSLIGAPAIVIPSGLGPNRLPLGLQLVAAPGDDRRLITAAAWCESTLPWIGAPPL